MGEGLISSGQLYCNGEPVDLTPKEVELDLECNQEIKLGEASLEFVIKISAKEWRKMMGYISQKRFRKLLYSIGYQRNQVNEIIEIEWKFKKSYNTRDVEYWRSYLDEKNRKD